MARINQLNISKYISSKFKIKNIRRMGARLIVLFVVCAVAAADPQVTEAHQDVVAAQQHLLTRVDKSVEVTYTYNLVPNQKWNQFPDFAISIDLSFSQYVRIEYNIQYWTQRAGWSCTRVLIDGVQSRRVFRVAGGSTTFHSHQISRQVWLEKGKHSIVVEYLTTQNRDGGQGLQYWNVALFNVIYYIYR